MNPYYKIYKQSKTDQSFYNWLDNRLTEFDRCCGWIGRDKLKHFQEYRQEFHDWIMRGDKR